MEISMRRFHFTWIVGALVALTLNGCAPTPQDSAGARHENRPAQGNGTDGATRSQTKGDLYPTKLENCVTAVGADRSRCSASN
jgi:hypothetical protein